MRLIDADAFVEAIKGVEVCWYLDGNYETYDDSTIMDIIEAQPTIEAKEVVHGEWVKTFRYMRENINTGKLEPVYSCDCPICKWHTGNQGTRFNYCPNCGADMRTSAE